MIRNGWCVSHTIHKIHHLRTTTHLGNQSTHPVETKVWPDERSKYARRHLDTKSIVVVAVAVMSQQVSCLHYFLF
jgi:hypothetical protein